MSRESEILQEIFCSKGQPKRWLDYPVTSFPLARFPDSSTVQDVLPDSLFWNPPDSPISIGFQLAGVQQLVHGVIAHSEGLADLFRNTQIKNYYYKPVPIFYGTGPRFFGVELEIDEGGEFDANAKKLLELVNSQGEERLYCKHDGSLEDGFELVTHPMSLAYHHQEMPWAELLKEAVSMGYLSHQTSTCGLHVHVSRNAFGSTQEEQDAAIARVLYFFEKHWEELLKFSRRSQRQLDQWASRYGYKDQPREILDHAKKGCHAGRYTCVNLTNYETIEFRIFRGTLKYNTLIAALQLLDRICDVAIFLSDDELKAMSWTTFVSGCQAPELVQYLKERRLYVNEPVTVEEEV